jgi:hypothetical protein
MSATMQKCPKCGQDLGQQLDMPAGVFECPTCKVVFWADDAHSTNRRRNQPDQPLWALPADDEKPRARRSPPRTRPTPRPSGRNGIAFGLIVLVLVSLGGGAFFSWWNSPPQPKPEPFWAVPQPAPAQRPQLPFWAPAPGQPPPPVERPLAGSELDQALADLKGREYFSRRNALTRLAAMEPTKERRAEVLQALEGVFPDSDVFLKIEAAKTMRVWGPKECVPTLIGLLEDSNHGVRWEVLRLLGQLQDERAVEAMVKHVDTDSIAAVPALKAMGSVAEKAVAARLAKENGHGQVCLCDVLKQIGTKESIPTLERLQGQNVPMARLAQEALQAIRERGSRKVEADAPAEF